MWQNLLEPLAACPMVTLIGGGGKTSLMYYLVEAWKGQGKAALATATTKLSGSLPPGHELRLAPSFVSACREVRLARDSALLCTLALKAMEDRVPKLSGVPAVWLDELAKTFKDTLFVVEGDGAAGKPLKGHLDHEPVIPASCPLVIAVVGADVLGKPLQADWVHRPERAAELAGVSLNSPVTARVISNLLVHPEGYLHSCPTHSRVIVFINKVESAAEQSKVQPLITEILRCKHRQIQGIVIGSVQTGVFSWQAGNRCE